MRKFMLSALVMLVSFSAQAKEISSSKAKIAPSSVEKVITMMNDKNEGSSQKKLTLVVTDSGLSTDVSPRYSIYLGFASFAEMGNITADFKITDQVFDLDLISLDSDTQATLSFKEYRDDGMYLVKLVIDASSVIQAEENMRKECGIDFCYGTLKSSVSVTETAEKL